MGGYKRDWETLHRLKTQLLWATLGSTAALFGLFIILASAFGDSWLTWVGITILDVCYAALLLVMYLRVRLWRCPRCGNRFFAYSERHALSIFTKRCGNCNLNRFDAIENARVP